MRKFGLIAVLGLAVAALSACSASCPGGGTWCQNQPPQGGDGQGAEKPKAPAAKVVAPVVKH